MRIVITGPTGDLATVVVQHLRAESTHELTGPARRLPDSPDSPGADRRPADHSPDACHGAPVEAGTGADPVVRPARGLQPSHGPAHLAEHGAVLVEALGARLVRVRSAVVASAVPTAWHARPRQVAPGWLDTGSVLPMPGTARARGRLDGAVTRDGPGVFAESPDGVRTAAYGWTPAMRPRTVPGALHHEARRRSVPVRRRP